MFPRPVDLDVSDDAAVGHENRSCEPSSHRFSGIAGGEGVREPKKLLLIFPCAPLSVENVAEVSAIIALHALETMPGAAILCAP